MKTYKLLKEVNYNDVAFFFNVPIAEAKQIISKSAFPTSRAYGQSPTITKHDTAFVSDIEKPIRSVVRDLDGRGVIEVSVERHNKGVPTSKLQSYGENTSFIKAISFTGKQTILNDILNAEQYRKLQQIWLYSSVYGRKHWHKKTCIFIRTTDWAVEYLESRGIENVESRVADVLESKKELNPIG